MNLERELFAAILESPDDIALRLVYADWCDEQGDPRGEFIRIQCELAACVGPPIKVRHLKQREAELWEQHRRAWNGEIHRCLAATPLRNRVDSRRGLIRKWEYHRGFVEFAVVEARAFLDHPKALFQIGPLRRVKILRAQNCLDDLMQSPFLQRMQTVEFDLPNMTFEKAERLIARQSRPLKSLNPSERPRICHTSTQMERTKRNASSATQWTDGFIIFCLGLAFMLAAVLFLVLISVVSGSLLEGLFLKTSFR